MSEDSALRRAKAARVVREFPASLGAIARGELHLTGLLLLGPHLTEANHLEVLACNRASAADPTSQHGTRVAPTASIRIS